MIARESFPSTGVASVPHPSASLKGGAPAGCPRFLVENQLRKPNFGSQRQRLTPPSPEAPMDVGAAT